MSNGNDQLQTQKHLDTLNDALQSGTFLQVRRLIKSLNSADLAHLLESSPPRTRQVLWTLVDKDNDGDVLQWLSSEVQAQLLRGLNAEEVVALTEGFDTDDIVDILQHLPDRVTQEVLQSMDIQDRQRVEQVLTYDEDTAGGLMNTDTITVRPSHTLDVVLRYLRRHDFLPDMTDNLIVVNRQDKYLGLLPLAKLLVSDPNMTVREIMTSEVNPIPVQMSDTEVAMLFERNDWISAPVVSEDNRLLGRITIDDVIDVIREDSDHSLMSMAGLDEEEDTFAPVRTATPRRAIWLTINLATAFIAAAVINLFDDTLEHLVALAVLMPVVASMGGVAGSQTLTVVVRGMALGQIGRSNTAWLLNRELILSVINGLLMSIIAATVCWLWFGDPWIGGIIAAALLINLLAAAFAGVTLPILLKSMKIDPALAGSVALTTVTDAVGFLSFLGLATLYYLR
jgi:magnesium transporter